MAVALLVAASTLAGCAGPREDVDVGIREFPSDVLLGEPDAPVVAPAPVPPTAVVLTGPFLGDVPTAGGGGPTTSVSRPRTSTPGGSTSTTTPRAAARCPAADPLAAPAAVADNRSTTPPVAATYTFRNDGTFDVSGPNARKGVFPSSSTRSVRNVRTVANGFTYEVAAELAGTTTTTRYQVIPTSDVPGEAGLYIAAVRTEAPGATTSSFSPPLPLKLLEFPAIPGISYTSAGTDPATATSMSFTATIGNKVRVDACGTPLDAIKVDLTSGRVDGPGTNVEFTATYAIATQFGGLSVQDTINVTGREGLDTVSRKNTAITNETPRR